MRPSFQVPDHRSCFCRDAAADRPRCSDPAGRRIARAGVPEAGQPLAAAVRSAIAVPADGPVRQRRPSRRGHRRTSTTPCSASGPAGRRAQSACTSPRWRRCAPGMPSRSSLLARIGWVRDTVKHARRGQSSDRRQRRSSRAGCRASCARSCPASSASATQAISDLLWCEAHADKAPHPGWLREVYFAPGGVGASARRDREGQPLPGAERLSPSTPSRPCSRRRFSEDASAGPPVLAARIREVVPGTVYVAVRLRLHGVLLRRLGGPARTDRHRRRHARRLRRARRSTRCAPGCRRCHR